ncbi:MAG: V-type ATP synthase subunit F [Candidatus Omnitrophica bacterium]|nr:V-type ATP synthase subunit F [Candidatus Omnitrophota bacterium]
MIYFCMGDDDTVLGFQLAGVKGRPAHSPDEARRILLEAVADKDIGIVIMTEKVAEMIRAEVDRLSAGGFPLVLEIPGQGGPLPQRKNIVDTLRQAVGIKA